MLGNAISSGASPFGGDRAGIAAATLAGQQALAGNQTIAGLESSGYNAALSAYQNQQAQQNQAGLSNAANSLTASGQNASNYLNNAQNNAARAANAATQYAALGSQAQNQALTGASAQLQAGGLEQATQQAQDTANLTQFQQQQAYPLQQAQNYISALEGLPSTGGTSTTTQPAGNTLTSSIGALTSLAGLFLKEGGAVHMDSGGGLAAAANANIPDFQADFAGTPYDNAPLGNITPMLPQGLAAATQKMFPEGTDAPDQSGTSDNSLDAHPSVDTSGDSIKVHYPSDGTSVDTGLPMPMGFNPAPAVINQPPPPPDPLASIPTGATNPLLAAGLGMMASKSPFVLQGIGEGALQGLQSYQQQVNAQRQIAALQSLNDYRTGRLDISQGNALAYQDAAAMKAAGYRSATDDEKKALGVPVSTPLQIGPDGKAVVVGGSGGLGGGNAASADDIKSVGDAMINGTQPPVTQGLYKNTLPVKAYLAQQGFDLTKANQDWTATSRLLATMNGTQQTRLRQAVGTVQQSLQMISDLNDKWQAGKYPPLNSLRGDAAKLGALGPQAQSIYTQMAAQIADVTGELGTVLMGGNSPTDHAMELAAKNLDINSPYETLADSLAQMKENIAYRANSLKLGTAGIPTSTYNRNQPTPDIADPVVPVPSNISNPASAVPPSTQAPAPSTYKEGQTATGPNGAKMVFKGGHWVPTP